MQAQAGCGKGQPLAFPQVRGASDQPFMLQGVKVCRSFAEPWPALAQHTEVSPCVGVTRSGQGLPEPPYCSDTFRTSLRVFSCATRLQKPLWFGRRQSQPDFPEKWEDFHPQEVLAEQTGAASCSQNSLGDKEWHSGATAVRLCYSCTPQLPGGCALSTLVWAWCQVWFQLKRPHAGPAHPVTPACTAAAHC